jgi:hypothetical protein
MTEENSYIEILADLRVFGPSVCEEVMSVCAVYVCVLMDGCVPGYYLNSWTGFINIKHLLVCPTQVGVR